MNQSFSILSLLLLLLSIKINNSYGFVEEYRIDPQNLPRQERVPTTSTTTTTTESPIEPDYLNYWGYLSPICEQICHNVNTCKKLIQLFHEQIYNNNDDDICLMNSLYDCIPNQSYRMKNYSSLKERYYRHLLLNHKYNYYHHQDNNNQLLNKCPIRLNQCPQNYLPSGFGNNDYERNRCIPLTQCKYLQQIHKHLNEIHNGIHLC